MVPILKIKDNKGNTIPIPAIQGSRGKSAYEIAIDHGFEGTEEEWLESLRGERGAPYELTDADKTEIVNNLRATLPIWPGGIY
jgi:hypothetical protein